jgi:hypothetical protein
MCIDFAPGLEEHGCIGRKESQTKKENGMNMNLDKFRVHPKLKKSSFTAHRRRNGPGGTWLRGKKEESNEKGESNEYEQGKVVLDKGRG